MKSLPFLQQIKWKRRSSRTGISDSYNTDTFPEIHIERAEKPEKELDLLETPNTSVGYFLENLTDEEKRKENQLFAELYSWYLNSPDYCTMTKN